MTEREEIRYCDDFVMCLEHEDDARRVMTVLIKRVECNSWASSVRLPRHLDDSLPGRCVLQRRQ
jgi:hypothetical protein